MGVRRLSLSRNWVKGTAGLKTGREKKNCRAAIDFVQRSGVSLPEEKRKGGCQGIVMGTREGEKGGGVVGSLKVQGTEGGKRGEEAKPHFGGEGGGRGRQKLKDRKVLGEKGRSNQKRGKKSR